MFIAMNRFRVIPAESDTFERAWLGRESHLATTPGFRQFHLLRGPAAEDHVLYASFTIWETLAAFQAWTRSDQFRRAHAGAAGARSTTLGHPQLEGFEVLQTIGRRAEETVL